MEAHLLAVLAGKADQFVIEVGLDVFRALGQAGQIEGPQVDAREQVFAKASLGHPLPQVAHRARDQLEIALRLAVAAERQEALLFDGLEQHGLLVQPELPDLIQEQQAAVRAA